MTLEVESYRSAEQRLPQSGRQIIAQQRGDQLVVYQAYQPAIAEYAVANQVLGGPAFSYSRMSWIKPNFLWMMYRCGWCKKAGQERVLAIWIDKKDFESILSGAVWSTYKPKRHGDEKAWKQALKEKDVRLQWDPDHDPHGRKLDRRAIQLGLKDAALEHFGKHAIRRIEDITPFVREQKQNLDVNGLDQLLVPVEQIVQIEDAEIRRNVGL